PCDVPSSSSALPEDAGGPVLALDLSGTRLKTGQRSVRRMPVRNGGVRALLVSWLVTCCATTPRPYSRSPALVQATTSQFQKALTGYDQTKPSPLPCSLGYAANEDGYIIVTADRLARAGVSRGDRIASIGGVPTSIRADRVRALYQHSGVGPVTI